MVNFVFENCFLSAMALYVYSRDGRSLSIYGIWMHEIFFLSDILFTSCYFTCTCLVLEISLFGLIVVKHRSESFSYLAFRSIYAFKFSDGYKSTMDWCSVYLALQGLPKYIYLSSPLIFPTTYNGIRTKNETFDWHNYWLLWRLYQYKEINLYFVLLSSQISKFQPLTTELGQKTARGESLRALLPYIEWDRFVALTGSKSELRVTLSYLALTVARNVHSGTLKIWETGVI
jgi:hypothetical protein